MFLLIPLPACLYSCVDDIFNGKIKLSSNPCNLKHSLSVNFLKIYWLLNTTWLQAVSRVCATCFPTLPLRVLEDGTDMFIESPSVAKVNPLATASLTLTSSFSISITPFAIATFELVFCKILALSLLAITAGLIPSGL